MPCSLLRDVCRNPKAVTMLPRLKSLNPYLLNAPKRYQVVCVDPLTRGITDKGRKIVGHWLMAMTGLTFGSIVIGGVNRFTEPGLFMADTWHLCRDPRPRNQGQWLEKFEQYKQLPEYQHVVREHGEMTLSRFKFIWLVEWCRRRWDRLVGVTYAIPTAIFWYLGYFNKAMKIRVTCYGLLIGLQGLLGWYVVRNELKTPPRSAGLDSDEDFVGVPRVSHYRLAAHLSTAAILYSLFLWAGYSHLPRHPNIPRFPQVKSLKIWGRSTITVMFTALIFGAFVAGLDAGLIYKSWPKMADRWVPDDLVTKRYGSVKRNLVENPTAVQWIHRNLAYLTCAMATGAWMATLLVPGGRAITGKQLRNAAHAMLAATIGQSTIGIFALLNNVPVWLGAMHQGGSLVLLSTILWYTHCLRAFPK